MRERKNALADLKATENVRGNVLCCAVLCCRYFYANGSDADQWNLKTARH